MTSVSNWNRLVHITNVSLMTMKAYMIKHPLNQLASYSTFSMVGTKLSSFQNHLCMCVCVCQAPMDRFIST